MSLAEIVRRRAHTQAARTAYLFLADGEREEIRWTYAEVDFRARAIALRLRQEIGIERAILLFPPGLDFVAAFIGCLYAGVVAVPARLPTSKRHVPRLAGIVRSARPSVALTPSAGLGRLRNLTAGDADLSSLRWIASDELQAAAEDFEPAPVDGDAVAFLQYTSGSTAAPKGVVVTHANLLHNQEMIRCAFEQSAESIIVGWLPLFHDMGLLGNVLQPLYVGAPCLLMSPMAFLQRPLRWLEAISRHRGTTSGGPSFAYELCLRKIRPEDCSGLDLSCWRVAFNGAEPVRSTTLDAFAAAFGPCGFRREAFYPCYGLAEATLFVTGGSVAGAPRVESFTAEALERHRVELSSPAEPGRELVGCGRPWLGQEIAIVEPVEQVRLPPEEVGEIWLAGSSVAGGYWGDGERTAQDFGARLAAEPERGPFLRTGDLGFVLDGELFVTGRLKDLIILRGRNHYPQDLEATAERAHPDLRPGGGAAFSIEADAEERLVLAIEIEPHARRPVDEIFNAIRQAVTEEHEVRPYEVLLLRAGTLPKTSSGKVRRHACRSAFLAGELEVVAYGGASQSAERDLLADPPTRAELIDLMPAARELRLLGWLRSEVARCSGLDLERVPPNASLAGLGFDSLAAVELAMAVEQGLQVELPLATILAGGHPAALARELSTLLDSTGAVEPLVLGRGVDGESYPLSEGQQSLWLWQKMAPASAAYHVVAAADAPSTLAPRTLRRALVALADRHPVLRSTFALEEVELRQRPVPGLAPGWVEIEASALTDDEATEVALRAAHRPFDLASQSPLRVVLLRTSRGSRLVWAIHHIAADFWTVAILARELGELYTEAAGGLAARLPRPAAHYADFVHWQGERLRGPEGERQEAHWLGRLGGAPLDLELSTDRPRPAVRRWRGATATRGADRMLGELVRGLARVAEGTVFTVLLVAYQALLGRYAGSEDLLVGAPLAGRERAEWADVVGYFVNLVPFRARLSLGATAATLITAARTSVTEATRNQTWPFARLVERLRPGRNPSHAPIVQAVFVLLRAVRAEDRALSAFALGIGGESIDLGGLRLRSVALPEPFSPFDLTLRGAELAGGLALGFHYDPDLFDASTASRWLGHLTAWLTAAAEAPDRWVADLPCWTPAELRELTVDWARSNRPYPREASLAERFAESVRRSPDAVAVEQGGRRLTYAQFDEWAADLAGRLRSLGVGPDVPVGLCLERSLEMIVAMVAVVQAGGAYVPLDPGFPRERLAWLAEDAGVRAVIADGDLADRVPSGLLRVDPSFSGGVGAVHLRGAAAGPDHLAYIMYTSGSTGRPKGIAIPQRGVIRLVLGTEYCEFGPGQVFLQFSPVSFDASTFEIWGALLHGGRLVLAPPGATSLADLGALIARSGVTTLWLTAGLFHQMVEARLEDLRPLHQLLAGGDVLAPEAVRRALVGLPSLTLINGYGPTENTTFSSCHRMIGPQEAVAPVPIGRPIANSTAFVLDRDLRLSPTGVQGELFVGGDGLARGYVGRPDLTAERFLPDPLSTEPGGRLYQTGDRARWRLDGTLEFLGRRDAQIKIRGFRVELGEVEAALRGCPGVEEAAASAVEVASERRLVAWVAAPSGGVDARGLIAALAGQLPGFLIPSEIEVLSVLPLTENGKIDRRALADRPRAARSVGEGGGARTPTEALLIGLFADLLGLSEVGREDDFFALGGHSLLATRLATRVRRDLGVELPIANLFATPTVAGLAARLAELRRGEDSDLPPLRPARRGGELPLSFSQERLWFLDRLVPGSALYNVPTALRLRGAIDRRILGLALGEIVRRHEALRTTFPSLAGRPVQAVGNGVEHTLAEVDVGALSKERREGEVARHTSALAQNAFDLALGPLLRAVWLRVAAAEGAFLLTLHHIVCDGWSVEILARELAALYDAYGRGLPSPLPELPVQYPDYAVWQRGWLAGETVEREVAWWRTELAGMPAELDLPADRPPPPIRTWRGERVDLRWSEQLAARVEALARREGATLFMLLLAAFQALLGRFTGEVDVPVGTPVANRGALEIEGLIGFFANTLTLRGDLSGDPPFRELVGRVRERLLAVWGHQDLPFERLVEALAPDRRLGRSPLFQVLFVLQGTPSAALELSGVTAEPLATDTRTAKFDWTLEVTRERAGIAVAIEMARDRFDAATSLRFLGCLQTAIEGLVDLPGTPISNLALLSSDQRIELTRAGAGAVHPAPSRATLHELFEEQVGRTPDAIAVSSADLFLTYAELERRADSRAARLARLGVTVDTLVAVCLHRSVELVLGLLAVLKAGGAYLPLDPEAPAARREELLAQARPIVVLASAELRADFSRSWPVVALEEGVDPPARRSRSGASEQSLAYAIFTSGSTGRPKGVAISHGAIVNHMAWMQRRFPLAVGDAMLQKTPYVFDASVWELFGPLLAGGRLVMARPGGHRDPGNLAKAVAAERITILQLVPSQLGPYLAAVDGAAESGGGSLRFLFCGGEALGSTLAASAAERLGVPVCNLYGPTECAINATYRICRDLGDRPVESIGGPIDNVRADVLDERLEPLPVGAPGELFLGGSCLARGYLGRPDLTAERFLPDPWSRVPGERLYRTGDRVRRRSDGEIDYLGRSDRQVKIRGVRIEPAEIEAALLELPGVRQAVVLARNVGPESTLVAYVEKVGEGPPEAGELRRDLAARLPAALIPSAFAILAELPRLSSGKIDRAALLRIETEVARNEGGEPPRGPIEELVAGVFAAVLGIERIDRCDDFFDLGGHSLLATRAVARIEDALRIELALRELFEASTVAGLSARIEGALGMEPGPEPARPGARTTEAPLSFAQERLWFLDRLDPGLALYNLPAVLHFEGPLSVAALDGALVDLARRHESLRTRFAVVDGWPVQRIDAAPHVGSAWVDLTGLALPARRAERERAAAGEARRPFDLERGPLWRAALLILGAHEHALLLTLHHAISDGWSNGILIAEWGRLYAARIAERPASLPALPIQYSDYAVWQRDWLNEERLGLEVAWWRERLAGIPLQLNLPFDRPRAASTGARGRSRKLDFGRESAKALEAASRREGATLFMTLLASLQALLARLGAGDDLPVGVPIAGRRRTELEGLVGFLANTLVLRGDLRGDPSFRDLLARTRESTLAVHAHQDLPFEKLVEALAPERSLGRSPLFQVLFAWQNNPSAALSLPGLRVVLSASLPELAPFDLTFSLDGNLAGSVVYRADLFDAATIARWTGGWERLLSGALADPSRRLGDLPLLSEAERFQLEVEWNATEAEFPNGLIHRLVEAQAERIPDRAALVAGDEWLSYGELERRADRLARRLQAGGVELEMPVGLWADRGCAMVIALFGILKAGGAYLPLDPSYPPERLAFMLEDSGARWIVTDGSFLGDLVGFEGEVVTIDGAASVDGREQPVRSRGLPEGSAYLIYTSGSTGRPKAVQVPHRGVINFLASMAQEPGFSERDVLASVTTLSFDIAVLEIFLPLSVGARVAIVDRATSGDGPALLRALSEASPTAMQATPATWRLLIDAGWQAPRFTVLSGGEGLSSDLAEQLLARGTTVWNLYGPTETTIWSTGRRVTAADVANPGSISIGRPIANTSVAVVDGDLSCVPLGVPGELWVGGVGVARGYCGRPDLTAERFVPDPWSRAPGARAYRTGDRVRRRPTGDLEFLGRADHQVKVRGFRVELGEVEAALARHPGVRQAVVIAGLDATGEGKLSAFVVPGNPAPTAGELRSHLRSLLPVHMVPAAWSVMAELPLTPNGKVDRRALSAVGATAAPTQDHGAPRTSTERLLARIWSDLLGLECAGVEDGFFEAGGHSLLAMRLVSRVQAELAVDLPVRMVFEHPRLGDLAARLDGLRRAASGAESAPPIARVARGESVAPSFAQERLWFLDQLDPGSSAYNIPSGLVLEGDLDVGALAQAFAEIGSRHEALRTTLGTIDGRPVAVIASSMEGSLRLKRIDIARLPGEKGEAVLGRLAAAEAALPFRLARGPLVRCLLIRLAPTRHGLLLVLHHAISDGWSMEILVREVGELYEAYRAGRPSPLAGLPIQYADYAAWQRSWLAGERLAREISWWRERLAGAPEALALPADRPNSPSEERSGATLEVTLGREVTAGLDRLSRVGRATPFLVLLASFQALLARWSGQDDVVVGTPIANRPRVELEGLIGFFANTLALRGDLSGDPSFELFLARVRESTLSAFAHPEVPFEKLVEELSPRRRLGRSPLFQVLLTLQNMPWRAPRLGGMSVRGLPLGPVAAKFDLTLSLRADEEGLSGALEYDSSRFERTTMARLAGHWERLLRGALADPSRRISELPLLSPWERWQLLGDWADTSAPESSSLLQGAFEAWADWAPDAVAAVSWDRCLSYGELARRAAALARRLNALGVGLDGRVGVWAERSLEMVIGLLGVLGAGAGYLALEPDLPEERLSLMVDEALGAGGVVLAPGALPGRLGDGLQVLTAGSPEDGPFLRGAAGTAESTAYVLYTSGSTGRPKAVVNSHRGIVNRLRWAQAAHPLAPGDRVLQKTPLGFDVSVWELFLPLSTGACLVLALPGGHRDPAYLRQVISEEEITTLHFVPSMLQAFLEGPPLSATALRWVIASGEALSFELEQRALARLRCRVLNLYGPTEAAVDVTWMRCGRSASARPVPIGRPIWNTRIAILDRQGGPVPVGVAGELHIGGVPLSRGYLGRPELTAAAFVPDDLGPEPGGRLYLTGDLARWLPTGEIEYLGRLDHQVKVRGVRIELGEIESALSSQPEVRDAVVLARPESGGGSRLVAYLVGRSRDLPSSSELRSRLRSRLPEAMLPASFVALASLPLTASGKADRRALAAIEWVPVASSSSPLSTPTEELLSRIWSDLLGLEQVGSEDGFFDLGGHSLLATRLVSRVRNSFGVELPLREVFEHSRLGELATRLDQFRRSTLGAELMLPIARVSREAPVALSFAQERLWFLDQLQPGSSAYNMPVALRLLGELSVPVLRASLSEVARRHESLRTIFVQVEGQPFQKFLSPAPVPLGLVDLGTLDPRDREGELFRLSKEHAERPFDLACGPLLCGCLVRLGAAEHAVLLNQHHVVSDGWSVGVLVREVVTLYGAFAAGRPSPLPELTVQPADFAVLQRGLLTGEVLERLVGYWRERLFGLPNLLTLPTDRPRPVFRTGRGARHLLYLPLEKLRGLKNLGRREGVTDFMTLSSLFQAFLSRLSGQEDLAIGTVIANRGRSELEPLIGFFANTLVLRADLSGRPSLRDLLVRSRESALAAYTHQDLPFEQVVEALKPVRTTSYTPLFQVLFVLQTTPWEALSVPGLKAERLEGSDQAGGARFDLTFDLAETPLGLAGSLEYATDIFDATTITRWAGHWTTLLSEAVAKPVGAVSELPLLGAAEWQQLAREWNDTEVAREDGRSGPKLFCAASRQIHELFEWQAAQRPLALAVAGQGQALSYAELEARANRLAHHLRRLGVGAETRVGLCVGRSPEMVVALLGILKAGGAYVPLDPLHPTERLALVLDDCNLAVLVTEERWLERLGIDGCAVGLRIVCLDRDRQRIAAEEEAALVSLPGGPESLAYVIYTSGSTGRPKGVCLPHGAVVNFLVAMARRLGLGAAEVFPALTTLTFDIAGLEIYLPLALGGRVEVLDREEAADGRQLAARLSCGITAMQATPATWRLLLDAGWEGQVGLKILCGGEALPRALASALRMRGDELWNLYGPTETAVWSAAALVPEDGEVGSVALGHPIAETRCHIVDREIAMLPLGAVGELLIGGSGLARGYWGRPELTAERFIPDPFPPAGKPGGRMYRTGDLARRLPDGRLDYLGRIDHQVKVRGFRIELGEIENALCRHAAVAQAAAGVRPGPGEQVRLVAYVVLREEVSATAPDLLAHLRSILPDFMIPSDWVFLAALPLTPNGKIDRSALPEPAPAEPDGERGGLWTPVEELLAGLWAAVLNVERVSRDDDFFTLGGHSLLATQVATRVRLALGVELAVRELFEAPTVRLLAARLADRSRSFAAVAQEIPVGSGVSSTEQPLSFAQGRLWFLDQLQSTSWHYNIPHAERIIGPLAPARLAHCLGEVVRRHEVLRASFPLDDGGNAYQKVLPPRPFTLAGVDLTGLPTARIEEEERRLATEEARRPFDLARGGLLRSLLLHRAAGPGPEHTLLLTLHHIVADAWSMGLLVREVVQLYRAQVEDLPSPLSDLPIQYGDFARWQREYLSGSVLAAHLAWWCAHLAGAPAVFDLPADRQRPGVQSFRGALHRFALPIGPAVAAFSRRHDATLFMTLLAVFQVLLGRLAGCQDFVVGTPIANRNRVEFEELIGLFANTLVLRGDLGGDPAFPELQARVRRAALGSYDHQDLPFEKLVEELAPERSLSRTPLFQVAFVVQNAPLDALELPGLTLRPLPGIGGTAKFDLTLALHESAQGLEGAFEYSTDLFDAATVARWAGHFASLLTAAVGESARNLSELPLLGPGERHQLREWSDPGGSFPRAESLYGLFAAQAARRPGAIAVTFGEERLGYGELAQRAERLARRLQALGVGPECRVGIFVERSLETVVAILGVLAAGGAYVPLDPAWPGERLAWVLDDAAARVLLTDRTLFEGSVLKEALVGLESPPALVWVEEGEATAGGLGGVATGAAVSPESLAYVIYTSGSTGRPKGVQVTHGNVVRLLAATDAWFGFGTDDVWTLFHSYAFDFSVWELWGALGRGGRLVVVPYWVSRSPESFAGLLRRERVTVLNQTPSAFLQLLRTEEERGEASEGGELSLRWVIFGGEALELRTLEPWFARHGDGRPRLVNMYGITETTVHVTFRPLAASDATAGSVVGRPIPDLQVYLLDEAGQPVPVGVPGEIYVGGAGLARGYLNRPELTAERFVPDPQSGRAGSRIYRSGDLVRYRATGDLEYLGRIDRQVKVRGFRIEPGEIEAALVAHPQVREAVVVAREEPVGGRRLVAYVVAAAPRPDPRELRAHLQERLPEHMIPAVFVRLDRLPLTANGKVDRRALPEPEPVRPEREGAAPSTPAEMTLARIWAEVLRLDRPGVHDNFFDLGGDSILSIQIVARARRAGLLLEPREIFEHQTIAELAAVARRGAVESAVQGLVTGPLPITPIQRWLLEAELLDPHHFNQSVFLVSREPLCLAALTRTVDCLMAHHDALRLRLESTADGWRQVIADLGGPRPVSWIDLSGLAPGKAAATLEAAAGAVQASLDLAYGPLARFVAFWLDGEWSRLLIAIHHWAIDGVSWRILLEDLVGAYDSAVRSEEIGLPAKSASFRDWALQLEAAAGAEALTAEVSYWREVVQGDRPISVPDRRDTDTGVAARSVSLFLTLEETQALLREVPEVYRTRIDEVLLAAYARAFALKRGMHSLRVDVEGHGRESMGGGLDLSRTVGWFTAIYPVRLEIDDPADLGACLKAVKERLRLVPGRGLGYGLLRYLHAGAAGDEVRALPRSESVFNYLGQLDQALPEGAPFIPATESGGPEHSPRDRRPYPLEVNASIRRGRFHTTWTYGSQLLMHEEVAGLAEAFLASLRDIIRHCRQRQDVSYSPADFPEVTLTKEQLALALVEIDLE